MAVPAGQPELCAPEPDAGRAPRIGVMGGTFDPIHHGHLVAASEVAHFFSLDEVVFVPTGQPWQKDGRKVAPSEDRYLMTVIATASNPRFSVSRVDIDRPGPTYTIDTLRELRAVRGDAGRAVLHHRRRRAVADDVLAGRGRSCSSWPTSSAVTRPGHRLTAKGCPGRGQPDRGPGAGDLLHGLPAAGRRGRAGLVPGAGRGRAVHRQAAAVLRATDRGSPAAVEAPARWLCLAGFVGGAGYPELSPLPCLTGT